jgi:hypothetical protein
MRMLWMIAFLMLSGQVIAQWSCTSIPIPNQGISVLINGGGPTVVTSIVDESKKDTWKTEVQWKSIDFKDNQFSSNLTAWPGIGPGFNSDSMLFFTQIHSENGKQMSKIYFKHNGKVDVLMHDFLGNDADPFFDEREEWLYFSSDRIGGSGGWDLYRTKWLDGQWSEPQNLGVGINSHLDERHPILNGDGLCFSSKTERGDWDIFLSPLQESFEVRWQLEAPINSEADEFQWVKWSEELGWLVSNRKQSSPNRNALFELRKQLEHDSFCFVFNQPFTWRKNDIHVETFQESIGCFEMSLGVVNHWQFLNHLNEPLAYEAFRIQDKNGETVAELFTDSVGKVSWEYLGLVLGDVQWLKVRDESYLLADNSGLIYAPSDSNRPSTPTVLFQKNQSSLEEVYQAELIELSLYLLLHPKEKVKLVGSFDAVGDLSSNERLAWERAFSVQSFLMAHGTLLNQIDVEIALPQSGGRNVQDRKVEIVFQ